MKQAVACHRLGRWTQVALLTCVLLAAGLLFRPAAAAQIQWDEWGVPHIEAADIGDALRGLGWAQMRAHANAELRLVVRERGRAAEFFGPGDNDIWISSDRWIHNLGLRQLAAEWLKAQTPEERLLVESFTAGLNAYAAKHPDEIDSTLRPALPVTPADVLARLADLALYTMAVSPGQANAVIGDWKSGATKVVIPPGAAASNGWAVGPSRSADGTSMLLINPHLTWDVTTRLFEAEVRFGSERIYGATFIGLPFIALGFNRYLGWAHTFNPMHSFYLYELRLRDGGYLWNGRTRPFAKRVEPIGVRRLWGMYTQQRMETFEASVHGPVLARQADKALALWVPGRDAPHMIGQYWNMARAHDLTAFQSAARQMQSPVFSIIYADRDGHIYYNFGGRNPTGPAAAVRRGSVLDGSTDKTLWTGVIPFDELPNTLDPPSGWLQNANDPPWTVTWPAVLQEKNFPYALVHPDGDFTNLRAQQTIGLFLAGGRLTMADLIAMKHRTHVELADRVLDDLIAAGRRAKDEDARAASEVLARWDRKIEPESRGASLFIAWALLYYNDKEFFAHPFDARDPLHTPTGLKDTALAAQRLARAARIIRELEGGLEVPWGVNHRLRRGNESWPANGASDPLGIPRVTDYLPDLDHGGFVAVGGDTFVAVVDFGRDKTVAQGLLGYGNFTQPPLPGVREQYSLFSHERLRELSFDTQLRAQAVKLTEKVP